MQAGDAFPDLPVGQEDGETVALHTLLRGAPAVVYFYPKDNTPGCTREAHDFQELLPAFRRAGVAVFGVSVDDAASHRRFRSACGLEFPLLVDAGGALSRALGILGERGTCRRTTYLLDSQGRVQRVWENVRVDGHAAEVLAAIGSAPSTGTAGAAP
jgi:peroxiredoxin Q/BCP